MERYHIMNRVLAESSFFADLGIRKAPGTMSFSGVERPGARTKKYKPCHQWKTG